MKAFTPFCQRYCKYPTRFAIFENIKPWNDYRILRCTFSFVLETGLWSNQTLEAILSEFVLAVQIPVLDNQVIILSFYMSFTMALIFAAYQEYIA